MSREAFARAPGEGLEGEEEAFIALYNKVKHGKDMLQPFSLFVSGGTLQTSRT